MSTTNQVDLQKLFGALQEELHAKLQGGQKFMDHPGAKGEATEEGWREMLRNYLPIRYQVDKAFVVDSRGARSDELDVVVFDRQYSPFLFHRDRQTYIPAESVYAVLEVKQTLNTEHVRYAGEKIASVRRLYRTRASVVHHVQGTSRPPKPKPILGGVLCSRSDWRPPFGESFRQALDDLTEDQRIDVGCVLAEGAFHYQAEEQRSVDIEGAETSLASFLLIFLERLQRLATVTPIDLAVWRKALSGD